MKRVALITVVLALACEPFELTGPPAAQPPRFYGSVSITHADSLVIDLDAHFQRGRDGAGRAYAVVDSTLSVDAEILIPTRHASGDAFIYSWRHTGAPRSDRMVLRVPKTQSALADVVTVIPLPMRLDSADLALGPDEDLRLHVGSAVVDSLRLTVGSAHWRLELRSACSSSSTSLSIQQSGHYPSELRLARSLLDNLGVDSLRACFSSFTSYRARQAPYPIEVFVTVRSEWRVTLTSAASGVREHRPGHSREGGTYSPVLPP